MTAVEAGVETTMATSRARTQLEALDLVTLKSMSERLDVAYGTTQRWWREGKIGEPDWRGDNDVILIWSWFTVIDRLMGTEREKYLYNWNGDR